MNHKSIRTSYFLSFIIVLSLFSSKLLAQQTAYFDDIQQEIDLAKELYRSEKYLAAYRAFEKIQSKADQQSEIYSESEYFKSAASLRAGHTSGAKQMKNFVDYYPESPYINQAWLNLGDYQFEKKQYLVAIKTFQNVEPG